MGQRAPEREGPVRTGDTGVGTHSVEEAELRPIAQGTPTPSVLSERSGSPIQWQDMPQLLTGGTRSAGNLEDILSRQQDQIRTLVEQVNRMRTDRVRERTKVNEALGRRAHSLATLEDRAHRYATVETADLEADHLAQLREQVRDLEERARRDHTIVTDRGGQEVHHQGGAPKSIHVKLPKFDGTLRDAAGHLAACDEVFEIMTAPLTDRQKIVQIGMQLEGDERIWYQAFAKEVPKPDWMMSYPRFQARFIHDRGNPYLIEEANRRYSELVQTGSVSDYTVKYRQYMAILGWKDDGTDNVLCSNYYRGLKYDIKKRIIDAECKTNLQALIHQAEEMGRRSEMARQEKTEITRRAPYSTRNQTRMGWSNASGGQGERAVTSPTSHDRVRSGATPSYLPRTDQTERTRRGKEGACYNCGKQGHFAKDCKEKEAAPQPRQYAEELPNSTLTPTRRQKRPIGMTSPPQRRGKNSLPDHSLSPPAGRKSRTRRIIGLDQIFAVLAQSNTRETPKTSLI